MKLELKHLTGYSSYGLKMINPLDKNKRIHHLVGLTQSHFQFDLQNGKYYEPMNLLNGVLFKPILRPLSDLTKEIEVNGKRFTPLIELVEIEDKTFNRKLEITDGLGYKKIHYIDNDGLCYWFCYYLKYNSFMMLDDNGNCIEMLHTYSLYQKLYEWHFDIYGLIKKNLAIDKNTL